GLQPVHERTSNRMNRAHDLPSDVEGVNKRRKQGMRVCSHSISGLPGEDYDMMMETAREVAKLDVHGLKIHLLHLLKGTPMVKQYEKGQLVFLSLED
ncbi:TIGR01212 family radical SAM protein, partial [Bacillus thuringiensis]|nr:TIGR01212 family radical SAM protein [Bacillus thuringiensis]